jgi:uncharacterized protein GlcG (DUF336 family)
LAVSVAVVDGAGRTKLVERMDGAGWFSPEIALAKAVGAAAFRADGETLMERFNGKELFANSLSSLSGGKIVLGQGGCVIRSGGLVIGAVGVSGAKSEEDADCARAGIAALESVARDPQA